LYQIAVAHEAFTPAVQPDLLEPAYRISTRPLPPHDQYTFWRDTIGSPAEFDALHDPSHGFAAEQIAWELDSLALTRTTFPAVSFSRTTRQLRADSIDHWFLTAPQRGTARTLASGRVTNATAGSLTIQSLQTEFEGQTTEMESVHLFVPRDFCRGMAAALDAADNTAICTGLGQLLGDYLLDLNRRLPSMTTDELPGLLTTIHAMILACVTPTPDTIFDAQKPIQAAILERARRLIQDRLFSPTLGPDELCLELGVSRSRLYRMFEPLGGVVHYIRHRRLLNAHAALSNTEDHRSIVEIAADRGFMDAAEFSRSFKREFGYRPTDARNVGTWPVRRQSHAAVSEDEGKLAALLMRLQ
jgi:AraC-like DNA-binding protein